MTTLARPSCNHPNRRAYNWLVYNIIDQHLEARASLINGSVYDFGAGASPYREYFLTLASEYIAVDWADNYQKHNIDITADLNKPLPIADNVADVVVSLSVLEHLQCPQGMLDEGFRVLKPGGAILLQVPWQWWVHEAPHDFFRYTPYGLRYLLENSGFQEIEIKAQAGFFTTIVLKCNYFSLRFVRGPLLVRWAIRKVFTALWYVAQKAAPFLDRLDRNWSLETSGYFITARKH